MNIFIHRRFDFMNQALKDEYVARCQTMLNNAISDLQTNSDAMEADILAQYTEEEINDSQFLTTEDRKGACYYEMLTVLRLNAAAVE